MYHVNFYVTFPSLRIRRLFALTGAVILVHSITACSTPTDVDSAGYLQNTFVETDDVSHDLHIEQPSSFSNSGELIKSRVAEYQAIERDLIVRGTVAGAIKGGLVGFLIAEAPGGVAGAVVGGGGGYLISKSLASAIIREHRDYIQRRANLDDIMAAVREDRAATQRDIDLLSKYNSTRPRTSSPNRAPRPNIQSASMPEPNREIDDAINELRDRAEIRHVALQEILPIYAGDQISSEMVRSEIQESQELLRLLRLQSNLAMDDL